MSRDASRSLRASEMACSRAPAQILQLSGTSSPAGACAEQAIACAASCCAHQCPPMGVLPVADADCTR